jgi:predicted MFS family arabinose efflux permease
MQGVSSSGLTAWVKNPAIIIASAAIVLGFNMGTRQTFGLFLEPITLDLDISRSNFSFAIAVQNLIWGFLTPVFGGLADRYGTARCISFGGVLYVIGILLMALGGNAAALHLGAGVFVGIAVAACGFPLVLSAVARSVSEERRSFALGLAASGGSAGQFVLLPLSQFMISRLDWLGALVVLAALTAAVIPLAYVFRGKAVGDGGGSRDETVLGSIRLAMSHRGFVLLNLGFFVCGFHVSFIATHLPGYIVSVGHSAFVGATALSVIGLFNIIGGIAAGALGARFRKKYVLSSIYLARAVIMGALLLSPESEWVIFGFAAVFGLLWLSTVPLTSGLVGDIFGSRFLATLFGIVMCSHQIGAFCGAWFGGISYDLTGSYTAVWQISIVFGLLSAMLHWPIPDRRVGALQPSVS